MIGMATFLREKFERLERALVKTIEYFSNGKDEMGLASFFGCIDDLDDIVHTSIYIGEFDLICDLLPILRVLNSAVQNEDIIATADTLEYALLPFTKKALEGMDKA
jgi:hypothetical protein